MHYGLCCFALQKIVPSQNAHKGKGKRENRIKNNHDHKNKYMNQKRKALTPTEEKFTNC